MEDLFRTQMDSFKVDPSPGLWQKVHSKILLKQFFSFSLQTFNVYYLAAAISLAGIGTVALLSQPEPGIQEETTILKVPCLTLRENTEHPVTMEYGSNRLVGMDTKRIIAAYQKVTNGDSMTCKTPPLWDGHAAERIVKIISEQI